MDLYIWYNFSSIFKILNNAKSIFYDVINGSGATTPFKFALADKLGLDIYKDEKILDELISKYYNQLLEQKGIEGIITEVSFNAGMPYFMVPNPSKYIEIL